MAREEEYRTPNNNLLYELRKNRLGIVQGDNSLVKDHSMVKRVWEEFSHYRSISEGCSPAAVKVLKARDEEDKLIDFLMGFNSSYESMKDRILLLEPSPTGGLGSQVENLAMYSKNQNIPGKRNGQEKDTPLEMVDNVSNNWNPVPASQPGGLNWNAMAQQLNFLQQEFNKYSKGKQPLNQEYNQVNFAHITDFAGSITYSTLDQCVELNDDYSFFDSGATGYSFDAGYNSCFESTYMSPKMLSCLERIDKLLDDIEKKNASYFSQEDCYHSNVSVYQPPPPQPTLRESAARQLTLRELAARQPTLRELAALQSSPCQPTLRQLASSYQQPPAQPQLSVREAALRDWQSEKGQQLIKEVNQYRLSVGLPEYDPIGNLRKLNKNEKISEDDSLVQSPHPPSQTEPECEELEETEEINSLDSTSSPDSSSIYIVVKHDSLILRVGDKDVDQVDFDESNIPIVSKEGFQVDKCDEVVHSIRDSEDDMKNSSMKDQEEDQWYKIEFEKEDVVVLEYKFIFSHGKENNFKRFIVAAEYGFFWYRDGFVGRAKLLCPVVLKMKHPKF
ncbi:OLC1v1000558C1 [Oldenlandia corymbosa var. corymbosa]|uniref:OLC1v1000558C1 n=1 Tax=Oldenlandia corymbosa var. corymbosa TaxID=529605 RepID=A0AAV1D311_OLDCO|nr:OLC1v1000558C1 [Oldenlandia corymbosa var. corymbosa]